MTKKGNKEQCSLYWWVIRWTLNTDLSTLYLQPAIFSQSNHLTWCITRGHPHRWCALQCVRRSSIGLIAISTGRGLRHLCQSGKKEHHAFSFAQPTSWRESSNLAKEQVNSTGMADRVALMCFPWQQGLSYQEHVSGKGTEGSCMRLANQHEHTTWEIAH